MRQTGSLAVALLVSVSSLFAADPGLLNMTPPGAQMYAGINVTQAKTTPFGQFLLRQIPNPTQFEQFVQATGFNPTTDVSELLIAIAPPPAANPAQTGTLEQVTPAPAPSVMFSPFGGLMLAKGTFNVQAIVAASTKDTGLTVSTYAGATLVTVTPPSDSSAAAQVPQMAFGFPDASTAVAGELSQVQAALDRRSSQNAIDSNTAVLINQLSTTEDVWSVSTANFGTIPFPGNPGANGNSAVLASVKQFSGGVKFGANVAITAQAVAGSAQDASSLADVIKLLAQMGGMQSNGNTPNPFAAILQTLAVTTSGATVNVSLTVPEAQLESIIESAHSDSKPSRI